MFTVVIPRFLLLILCIEIEFIKVCVVCGLLLCIRNVVFFAWRNVFWGVIFLVAEFVKVP